MEYTAFINALLHYGSLLLTVMAALVFATTIIVEVVKNLFPKVPTNFVATGVAIIVTVLAAFILCGALGIPILWYYIAGAVILGIFVAYAAMFGFDKFKAALEKLKVLKK